LLAVIPVFMREREGIEQNRDGFFKGHAIMNLWIGSGFCRIEFNFHELIICTIVHIFAFFCTVDQKKCPRAIDRGNLWRAVWSVAIIIAAREDAVSWSSYELTCEGPIQAWAAVARERTHH